VRNKPNFARGGPSREPIVQNEPNSRRYRVGRGHRDVGQSCKTNPISRGAGRDGATGAWDVDQSCETKPICESHNERQVVGGTMVMGIPAGFHGMKNEANSGAQSDGRGPAWLPAPQTVPIVQNEPNLQRSFKCEVSSSEPNVQNEPNPRRATWHGHLARESGPWAGRPCHCSSGRIAQNEANLWSAGTNDK